jgi:hypothetical protein
VLDERITKVKDLISQREEIDTELAHLFGIEARQAEARSPRRCSKCGEAGHRATNCSQGKDLVPSSTT